MLDEDDRTECASPVPNETEEVRECVIELVRSDDGDRDKATEKVSTPGGRRVGRGDVHGCSEDREHVPWDNGKWWN